MADEEKEKKEENQKSGEEKTAETIEEKLAKCERQRDEYLAGWQRAKADFVNYKKDEINRLEEVVRFGTEDLIEELISVLDNFNLAIAAIENQKISVQPLEEGQKLNLGKGMERGIYMIRSQIEDVLKKRGLSKVQIKIGEQFNPAVAEAIAEVESDQPAGAIVEEIEAGYLLHDKLIRPARVKISKGHQ
jgi:molecular chaperone GrpE